MSREEFIKELEYLLQDIPEEEKADALDYYRDYLEEAGDDGEEAIRDFGSPERIAAIIRSDIAGHLENGGEFTERGYEDERFRDPNYQVSERYDLPEQGEQSRYAGKDGRAAYRKDEQQKKQNSNTVLKVVLVIILLCVASPIWLGLGGGLIGLLAGLAGGLLGVAAALAAVTVAMLFAGVVCVVAGVIHAFVNPLGGFLAIGIGLLAFGLGLLCLMLSVQFYGRFIPWLIRSIINLFNGLFHRRERKR